MEHFEISNDINIQQQFDTPNQKDINLKLWKPYPISPFS